MQSLDLVTMTSGAFRCGNARPPHLPRVFSLDSTREIEGEGAPLIPPNGDRRPCVGLVREVSLDGVVAACEHRRATLADNADIILGNKIAIECHGRAGRAGVELDPRSVARDGVVQHCDCAAPNWPSVVTDPHPVVRVPTDRAVSNDRAGGTYGKRLQDEPVLILRY